MSSYPTRHYHAHSSMAPAPPAPPAGHHPQAHGSNIPSLAYPTGGIRGGMRTGAEYSPSFPPPPTYLPHSYEYESSSNHYDQWTATAPSSIGPIRSTDSYEPPTTSRPQEGKKKLRTQFSACRQCRSRRVRCDLREKQETWDRLYGNEVDERDEVQEVNKIPNGVEGRSRDQLKCSNCTDRQQICIDVFADIKAAKQTRKTVTNRKLTGESSAAGAGSASGSMLGPDAGGGLQYGSSPSSGSPGDGGGAGESSELQGVCRADQPQQHNQHHQQHQQQQSLRPHFNRQVSYASNQPSSPDDIPLLTPHGVNPPLPLGPKPVVLQSLPRPYPAPTASGWEPAYTAGSDINTSAFYPRHGTLQTTPQDNVPATGYMPMEGQYAPPPPPPYQPAAIALQSLTTEAALSAIPQAVLLANSPQCIVYPRPLPLPEPVPHLPDAFEEMEQVAIPELTASFLQSPFYRRFHVQRPIIDPDDFAARFFSTSPPSCANLGSPGFILCHVLYAWACSYGVNEAGELDVNDEDQADAMVPAVNQDTSARHAREHSRNLRKRKTNAVVKMILKEIDDATVMRRQTWDGVRCLLLILPLTEYVSTPMERLAMYECAIAQVFSMCSLSAMNYDGYLGNAGGPNSEMIRIRLYWYSFVHEGITTGLKGGRLVLDEEDLETFHATLPHGWQLVHGTRRYQSAARLATAPIRLAMACRLIHKALTGPKARRREHVSKAAMYEAWESLEQCWLEFDSIASTEPSPPLQKEDIVRFSDGWKIFMFEAHNICREMLSHRLQHHVTLPKPEAFFSDLSMGETQTESSVNRRTIEQLHEISRAKCRDLTRQILGIVRKHVGSTFFLYDASLVRDGTYYTAMLLANEDGTEEDIAVCLQALSEMRWGFAKTAERSAKLRETWNSRNGDISNACIQVYSYASQDGTPNGHPTSSAGAASTGIITTTTSQSNTASPSSLLPPARTIIDELSISGLGANPSGWYLLADTASLSASATDFIGIQQGAVGDGMYGQDFGHVNGGVGNYDGQGGHQAFYEAGMGYGVRG